MKIISKMTSLEFNYYAKRACTDNKSFKKLYSYCLGVIKIHINCKFGGKIYDANIPHDVFTKVFIENPPKKPIANPVAWLCRIADNYIISMYKLKDNQTVELTENYGYVPEYGEGVSFTSEDLRKAWDGLDEVSRYIVYLNTCLKYQLNEIAAMLDKEPEYVRTKKCRALKDLKKAIRENDKNCRLI